MSSPLIPTDSVDCLLFNLFDLCIPYAYARLSVCLCGCASAPNLKPPKNATALNKKLCSENCKMGSFVCSKCGLVLPLPLLGKDKTMVTITIMITNYKPRYKTICIADGRIISRAKFSFSACPMRLHVNVSVWLYYEENCWPFSFPTAHTHTLFSTRWKFVYKYFRCYNSLKLCVNVFFLV